MESIVLTQVIDTEDAIASSSYKKVRYVMLNKGFVLMRTRSRPHISKVLRGGMFQNLLLVIDAIASSSYKMITGGHPRPNCDTLCCI